MKKTTKLTMEQQFIKRLTIEGNELRRLKQEQFLKHEALLARKNQRIDYLEHQRDGLIDVITDMADTMEKTGMDMSQVRKVLGELRELIGQAEVL